MLKSPLRYPGGKQKAIANIAKFFPSSFKEFREPFVGGGSVCLYVLERHPDLRCWINDLNPEVYHFWYQVKINLPQLCDRVWQIRAECVEGRALFAQLTAQDTATLSSLDRAVRFFILNRITFSGVADCGGYSEDSFKSRFTDSAIARLEAMEGCFDNTWVTNLDYSILLMQPGQDVFFYLDPPYLSTKKSKLYGSRGDLHTKFDSDRFVESVSECPHRWLISYDDCEEVRQYFNGFYIRELELQYGMNNYKQEVAAKGKELLISNYPINI